ncbi:MAG: HDIG domain-containing metalloprotein [Candidatus Margulisiibacteriota bacterium]|nr:HDIG domain-containing protein [Candidatus Margulisiibacteriota bacterium]
MLDRLKYRFGQLKFGLTSAMNDEDRVFVRRHLDIQEQALFNSLPDYEQKHAVVVAQKMLNSLKGRHDLDGHKLAKIGLLHDIGKAAVRLSIFDKAAMVALKSLSPWLYDLLSQRGMKDGTPRFFRKFFVYKHHGEIGAEMLRKIGVEDEVLTCVEAHDAMKFGSDKYLRSLQDADSTL